MAVVSASEESRIVSASRDIAAPADLLFELIADPGLDRDGLSLALDAAKKRVHVQRKVDDDF